VIKTLGELVFMLLLLLLLLLLLNINIGISWGETDWMSKVLQNHQYFKTRIEIVPLRVAGRS
jgi:hypothetical protein